MRSTAELRADILSAAGIEFALRGLAGARIDRIVKDANTSKERLYAHFGGKESLFQEVVRVSGISVFSTAELRPDNVAEFAGRIFDLAREHPDHMRMIGWAQLEGLVLDQPPTVARNLVAGIGEAQAQGFVDGRWDPRELVVVLFGLGLSWVRSPDHAVDRVDEADVARRRAEVVEAARRIVAPATH